MALFGKKEEKKDKKVAKKAPAKKSTATKTKKKDVAPKKVGKTTSADLSWVLVSPRITERTAIQSEDKVFVFNVHVDSNKIQIKEAIKKQYNVVPEKVNIAKIASKPVFRKGVKGKKSQGKKAYVYLNKKDSIQFV